MIGDQLLNRDFSNSLMPATTAKVQQPVWAPTLDAFEEAVVSSDGDAAQTVASLDGHPLDVSPEQCGPRSSLPSGGYDDNTQVGANLRAPRRAGARR
jgi:hypothetical protein